MTHIGQQRWKKWKKRCAISAIHRFFSEISPKFSDHMFYPWRFIRVVSLTKPHMGFLDGQLRWDAAQQLPTAAGQVNHEISLEEAYKGGEKDGACVYFFFRCMAGGVGCSPKNQGGYHEPKGCIFDEDRVPTCRNGVFLKELNNNDLVQQSRGGKAGRHGFLRGNDGCFFWDNYDCWQPDRLKQAVINLRLCQCSEGFQDRGGWHILDVSIHRHVWCFIWLTTLW